MEEGSLYPALHRMEQAGWIRAEWKLSDLGRQAKFLPAHAGGDGSGCRREEARWQKLTRGVAKVLRPV